MDIEKSAGLCRIGVAFGFRAFLLCKLILHPLCVLERVYQ